MKRILQLIGLVEAPGSVHLFRSAGARRSWAAAALFVWIGATLACVAVH